MKALSVTILLLGCLAAIIFAPEYWLAAVLVAFIGCGVIDEL